jgi:hypothetical protein
VLELAPVALTAGDDLALEAAYAARVDEFVELALRVVADSDEGGLGDVLQSGLRAALLGHGVLLGHLDGQRTRTIREQAVIVRVGAPGRGWPKHR